jgi:hypothetical protein
MPIYGAWTNWMYKEPPVRCINIFASVYAAAGLSIAHDIMILVFPLPILWNLNLSTRKKANLFVMFLVGSFVIVCSCLRIPSLKKIQNSVDPTCESIIPL